jgi:hypothetical protein
MESKRDRTAWLVLGSIFVLLGIVFAMLSVSLGTEGIVNGSAYSSSSFLVYNPFVISASLVFATIGGYFFYRAGKSANSLVQAEREASVPMS